MIKRQYLKTSSTLLLCEINDGQAFQRTFTILHKVNMDAYSVSYEASYNQNDHRVLQEIYPSSTVGLAVERNGQGQLIPSRGMEHEYKEFKKLEKDCLEPYHTLLKAKKKSDYQDLSTFIPSFEIYYGCDEEGHRIGTSYILMPDTKLETFETLCKEIHVHPKKEPEHKLVFVLNTIRQLASCVCAMHYAGLVCRNITPSNFGFLKESHETLAMVNINDVCSVFNQFNDVVMNNGYTEMEAGYEMPNNQTDIYSIGAVLFHALIITDETCEYGFLYSDNYYHQLKDMVDNSALIQASEANNNPHLRFLLTTILKKCLCERRYRYPNCEALIDDLDRALSCALPMGK